MRQLARSQPPPSAADLPHHTYPGLFADGGLARGRIRALQCRQFNDYLVVDNAREENAWVEEFRESLAGRCLHRHLRHRSMCIVIAERVA